MNMIEGFICFWGNVSAFFQKVFSSPNDTSFMQTFQKTSQENFHQNVNDAHSFEEVTITPIDEVSLAKRTLTNKLYVLEQEIEVFKKDFPDKFNYFFNCIQDMRNNYLACLEEIKAKLTFEIDPELNSRMTWDISKLEKEIKTFIDTELKFHILSQRLQKLIAKLNILYNVSIWHPDEKDKVVSQAERALISEAEMAEDFKECEAVLDDCRLKDRLVSLFSYADYQIFKIVLRNSNLLPETVMNKLVLFTNFKDFDYVAAFKAFVEDELSDLGEMLPQMGNDEYQKIFEKKIGDLLKEFAYAENIREYILNRENWYDIFELESSLLELLKNINTGETEKIKVKLIDRLKIEVKKNEILTLPKTNAYLALISVFSVTRDEKILLLIKLFKNISSEITYKEIYFLLQLFDAIDVIQNTSNVLKRYMEKYIQKYPYNSQTIWKKKKYVLNSTEEKQYVMATSLDEDADKMISTLNSLKLDFKIVDDKIYINSFYFNGLENVFVQNNS